MGIPAAMIPKAPPTSAGSSMIGNTIKNRQIIKNTIAINRFTWKKYKNSCDSAFKNGPNLGSPKFFHNSKLF